MATLDAQDVRATVSELASSAADASASIASSFGDALSDNVFPKLAEAGTSLVDAASSAASSIADAGSSAASSLADAGSSFASAAADRAEDVDTEQLKKWWPIAAVVAVLVAIGVVHQRKRSKAAEEDPGKL
jgi:hypothetical protein